MSAPEYPNSPDTDAVIRKRIWLVQAYWFYRRSCARVIEEFRRLFPQDTPPNNSTIQDSVKKFREHGTVQNLHKGRAGRPSTSTGPDNIERVRELILDNPTISLRRASQVLDISQASVYRIIKKKLKLYPYKIQVYQELTDYDMSRRLDFAREMIDMIVSGTIKTKRIWFSDEAHFWMTGYVNKQNYRFWGSENPRIFETTTLKPQRITVWCAMCEYGIIGPIFLDQNINGERYNRMLLEEFIPVVQGMKTIDRFWFMQDGALPHRTNNVFQTLDEHFTGRVIGLGYPSKYGGGLDWPPYSPDLNPCDFFLWGYLKDKVYRSQPNSLEELRSNIITEILSIDKTTLANVVRGFEDRLHAVIAQEGAHIEHYMH